MREHEKIIPRQVFGDVPFTASEVISIETDVEIKITEDAKCKSTDSTFSTSET